AEQYLKKGSKIFLEGSLQTRKWTDQQGVERYSTEVVLQNFNSQLTMLDGKSDGGSDYGTEDSGTNGDFGSAGPGPPPPPPPAPGRAPAPGRRKRGGPHHQDPFF